MPLGSRRKRYCNRDTRLWCLLVLSVVLYGGVWISTSSRIGETQSRLDGPTRQVESDSSGRYSTKRVANTKSTANNTHVVTSRSEEKPQNPNFEDIVVSGNKGFLSYRLEYDKPYNVTYGPHTQCAIGITTNKWGRKAITRVGLTEPFSKILNVTAYLQTNLKIITVGDSVGIQFHEVLEEALQPPPSSTTGIGSGNNDTYRTLLDFAWPEHESVSVTAPVNGGGALAALRMTGLLLEEGRGKPPPNKPPNIRDASGGWLPERVRQILDYNYTMTTRSGAGSAETITTTTKTIDSFDVMIFRMPHGWLPASSFTRERMETSVRLAKELFGVHTVIIQTLFLNNNVKTMDDLNEMRETNRVIRELVDASWGNSDIPNLLLMDFGGWVDQLTELNAQLAGMDTKLNSNYTLERLGCAKYPPTIAMSCVNNNVRPGDCKCIRNVMSIDGMHWCMETLGGRIIGGMSCLMQCSLLVNKNNSTIDMSLEKKRHLLGNCQQHCNDQFMSLRDASSLVANIPTAYS